MSEHTNEIQGFDGSEYRIGIVTGSFNADITDQMLDHCIRTLTEMFHVSEQNITSVRVAGSADAPAVLSAMAKTKRYDALIVMGAVVRGSTAHFDYVNDLVTQGVRQIQVEHAIAIAFGVLMCDTKSQAVERIPLGAEYAAAAMQTAKTIKEIQK